MTIWLFTLGLVSTASAQSFSKPMSGFQVDVGPGAMLGLPPTTLGAGARVSAGVWWGPYDESYAIGRFNAVVLDQRVDLLGTGRGTTALAYRRGIDLLVVKPWGEVAVGFEPTDTGLAPVGRVGGGVKYRFRPFLGAVARLDAGAAFLDDGPALRASAMLGLEWSQPWRRPGRDDD